MNIRTPLKYLACTASLIGALTLFSCSTAPEQCKHTSMTKTVTLPTHTVEGKTEYRCEACNNYSYTVEFVPPLGHTLVPTAHEPSCTAQGYTEYKCDCGYSYKSDYTAPLGHTLLPTVYEPSCTAQGYTEYECGCGYGYKSDYTAPLGHTLSERTVEPTCDTEGHTAASCSVCELHYTYDIKAPLGHELTVTTGYVSVKNGSAATRYKCSRCTLDYEGAFLLYRDVYTGAYVENTEVLARGIDASHHNNDQTANGSLDWQKIKAAGFDFVILKAGEMATGNIFVPDSAFEANYQAARNAGLQIGAYIYSNAYSTADARAEAEAMIEALDGKQFEYPIFFDIEYSDKKITDKGLTPRAITDICIEFISTMQDNGYFTALYTNNKWLTEHLIKDEVTELFDIWYARYLHSSDEDIVVNEATWNTEKYGAQMAMWQFSETGTIDGLVANDGNDTPIYFDINYCYKDYPTLIKQYGLNGFEQPRELLHLDGVSN